MIGTVKYQPSNLVLGLCYQRSRNNVNLVKNSLSFDSPRLGFPCANPRCASGIFKEFKVVVVTSGFQSRERSQRCPNMLRDCFFPNNVGLVPSF
jgi:hypothetical protein